MERQGRSLRRRIRGAGAEARRRGRKLEVAADVNGKPIQFGLTPGAPHRLQNALAALASIHAAGLDTAALAKELSHVGIMTGRGVEQAAHGVTVIDDSFNGNPASMVAALGSLKARPVKAGRRIAILGDMLELGADASAYHEKLAKDLAGNRRHFLRRPADAAFI